MKLPRRRWFRWTLALAGVVLVGYAAWRFPWIETRDAVFHARPLLIVAATLINLTSLVSKGWAWHLLLKPVVPHRWSASQSANLIGAAVNNVSVSVAGEAARVQWIAQTDRVPFSAGVASVIWARAIEGVALAFFLLAASSLLRLPPVLRVSQVGVAVGLCALFFFLLMGRGVQLPRWAPHRARSTILSLSEIGSPRRLIAPLLLCMWNWVAEWGTFHLVLCATTSGSVSPGASFAAMIATNVGGALRLTPANVGVFQVSMIVGLLAFGIPRENAMAAALVLQAIQVLPVLALGIALVGVSGLRRLRETAPIDEEVESVVRPGRRANS